MSERCGEGGYSDGEDARESERLRVFSREFLATL
jgi:hypothetical protein